mmetsp:Transcript_15276/g.31055  ORF Transcript_15276/g.31055 Transcript_15276/m.31055 type:complete len:88 (+) Transcript_15276:1705-1968(+)
MIPSRLYVRLIDFGDRELEEDIPTLWTTYISRRAMKRSWFLIQRVLVQRHLGDGIKIYLDSAWTLTSPPLSLSHSALDVRYRQHARR